MTRVVIISDTHNKCEGVQIPDGDILIHAGDGTMMGKLPELERWATWMNALPHKRKCFIAGNHDFGLENHPGPLITGLFDAVYLQDSLVEIEGLKIYGTPWCNLQRWAFFAEEDEEREYFERIPAGIDILVSHVPPFGVLDEVVRPAGTRVGSNALRDEVFTRVKPQILVFGHIHESYGQRDVLGVHCVNASLCDEHYRPVNAPVVVDL